MGLFDHYASMDWNGDGRIDSWDDAIEFSVNMQIQDDINREERISKMVRAITRDGVDKQIDNAAFQELCEQENLNMNDFEQWDIEEIQRRLSRW